MVQVEIRIGRSTEVNRNVLSALGFIKCPVLCDELRHMTLNGESFITILQLLEHRDEANFNSEFLTF